MNNDDFFSDILNSDDNNSNNFSSNQEEKYDFDFEDENYEEQEIYQKDEDKMIYENKISDNYKRNKSEIQNSVETLQGNIKSMLSTINIKPEDMYADKNLLPGLDIQVEKYDYEKDLELIKIDSKETLECLANLYLTEDMMKAKNVYKIIKDDASNLSKLNFSIQMGQKSLISCMNQLDLGVNDPEMYQAVTMFMKEIRDNVKMAYEIQRKMKDFYKELKEELQEINAGEETIIPQENNYTIIGDPKMLNDLFDQFKDDPTMLKKILNK
jgi:hypothetical protein